MSANNEQMKQVSPADYQDFDFKELQVVADYIMRDSIPKDLTIAELNDIVAIYSNFLNISLYNLNLLRDLAGHDPFQIPKEIDTNA